MLIINCNGTAAFLKMDVENHHTIDMKKQYGIRIFPDPPKADIPL
jgi:hypothetical protein